MGKYEVIDAEFWPIKEGRSAAEIKAKRRKQFWTATIQGLALAAGLMAITASVTALLMQVLG